MGVYLLHMFHHLIGDSHHGDCESSFSSSGKRTLSTLSFLHTLSTAVSFFTFHSSKPLFFLSGITINLKQKSIIWI